MSLAGTGTQTQLSRSPATLAFGPRDIDDGPTAAQTSTISNSGTEPVTISAIALAGADAGHFARLTGAPADCTSTTTLSPGQTCELRARFDPSATGAKNATITVASNAPDATVALSGTGTQTELSRSPATLAFGPRDIDDGAGSHADRDGHEQRHRAGRARRLLARGRRHRRVRAAHRRAHGLRGRDDAQRGADL